MDTISAGMKAALMQSVTSDEDVLLFWMMPSAEWEEAEEQALLDVNWITILICKIIYVNL